MIYHSGSTKLNPCNQTTMKTPRFIPALTAAAGLALASCNCADAPLPKEVEDEVEDVRGDVGEAVDSETPSAESEFEALIASLPDEKKNDPELVQVLRDLAQAGIDIDGDDNGLYSIVGKIDRSNMHLKDKLIILKQLGIRIDGELFQALATGGGGKINEIDPWMIVLLWAINSIPLNEADDAGSTEQKWEALFEFIDMLAPEIIREFRRNGLNQEADIIELVQPALREYYAAFEEVKAKKSVLPDNNDDSVVNSALASKVRYGKTKAAALDDSIEILLKHATLTVKVMLSNKDSLAVLAEKIFGKEEAGEMMTMLDQDSDAVQIWAQKFERSFFDPEQVTSPEYLAVLSRLKAAGMKLDGPVKGEEEQYKGRAIIYSLPYELAMNKSFVDGLLRLHQSGVHITMGAKAKEDAKDPFWRTPSPITDEDNVMLALTVDNKGADSAYVDLMLAYHNAGGVVDEELIDNISLEEAHDPEFGKNLIDSAKNGVDAAFLDRKSMRNKGLLEALRALSQERGGAGLSRKFIGDVDPEIVINPECRAALVLWISEVGCVDDFVATLTTKKVQSDPYRLAIDGLLDNDGLLCGHTGIDGRQVENISLEGIEDKGYLEALQGRYDCGVHYCQYQQFPTYEEYKAGLDERIPEDGEDSDFPDDDDDTTSSPTPSGKDGKTKRDSAPVHEGPAPKDDIDKGRG